MRERTSRRALTATTPAGRRVFRRMVSAGWLLQNSAGDSCMIEGGLGRRTSVLGAVLIAFALAGCTTKPEVPAAQAVVPELPPLYQIGAGDALTIFVWRNAELTTSVVVRPDGRVSVPLIEDLYVEGKNPSAPSRETERSEAHATEFQS